MLSTVLPITLALWTAVIGAADLDFVNPPRFGSVGDFSSNAVYTIGQNLRVQWSEAPENVGISVLMYQLNADDGEYMLPGQYLFQNVVNSTIYDWTVAVSENLPATLSESNLFYLSIFQEGRTSSDSNSHYFNITEAKSTATSSSSSTIATSASTTSSTSTQMASSILPASTTSDSTTTPERTNTTTQASLSSSGAGMSTGTKIGIGAGILAAVILGIGAGWFFFGRRRRHQQSDEKGPSTATEPQREESAASSHAAHQQPGGGSGVPAYWGPDSYHYDALPHSKQASPLPCQHFSPQIYEVGGESRVTEPAELYAEMPNPREHPGHQPDSMRSYGT